MSSKVRTDRCHHMTFAWVRKLRTALHPLTVCRGLSAHHTFVDLGSCSQEVTTSALIVIYKQTSHHNVYTKYDRPFSIITFSHHYAHIMIILPSCTSHHSASPRLSHTLPLAGGRLVLSPVAPPTSSCWAYDRRRLL